MVGLIVETLLPYAPRVKVPTFLLLVICLTLGFITNTLHGTRDLTKNYRFRILPTSRLIEKQPQQFVIISHQWIAQELAVLMDKKTFLWARNSNNIHRIIIDPLLQDVNSILFITYKGINIPEEYRFLPVLGETENFIIRIIEK
ncbi:hypothetical protein K8T06_13915 [bacterium]|nr:hypothetical protein [bacterium]